MYSESELVYITHFRLSGLLLVLLVLLAMRVLVGAGDAGASMVLLLCGLGFLALLL